MYTIQRQENSLISVMIDVIFKIYIIRMTESKVKCEKKSKKYNYKNILLCFIIQEKWTE